MRAQSALVAATGNSDIGLVRILLDAGADVNYPLGEDQEGGTTLQTAAEQGDIELVRILLDTGAIVNGYTANRGRRGGYRTRTSSAGCRCKRQCRVYLWGDEQCTASCGKGEQY